MMLSDDLSRGTHGPENEGSVQYRSFHHGESSNQPTMDTQPSEEGKSI